MSSPNIRTEAANNLVGGLWMTAAMAGFALEDMFFKAASASLPVGELLVLFGLFGAILFALAAAMKGDTLFSADVVSRPMLVRAGFEISGRLFYGLALVFIPLSAATVILQATPLVVVAGAALVFKEAVGWRRWAAIIIGLAGVLIILQPGTDGFSMLSILAVLGMLGFAGRDLASRAAPATLSAWVLGVYGFLSIVVAGLIYSVWVGVPFVWPDAAALISVFATAVFGASGYACLMTAMRTGEVSAVTPFRYTRLLFGLGLGVFLFDEHLTQPMIIGCGLIVLSGLFILWRGKQVKLAH